MTRGAAIALVVLLPAIAYAGFTETAPASTFVLDASYVMSWVRGAWGADGGREPLVDEVKLYEPGGPLQGILVPDPLVRQQVLVTQVQYGVTDWLSVGLGVPVVLRAQVDPRFGWIPGEYQTRLGRVYSQDDFWQWAAGMGQVEPGTFDGNHGVLSDLVLGVRWRWSDHVPGLREAGWGLSLMLTGMLPTGRAADPDQVIAVGTTLWDLMAQGDLGAHLGVDKGFADLDDRLSLGLDLYYEAFFRRTRRAPRGGTENLLLLNQAPYVGETYTVKPGDWAGAAFQVTTVPWKGPALGTWLTGGDQARAARLPPLLSVTLGYRFVGMQQTDYASHSPHWDWNHEKERQPGWRHYLAARVTFSFLRLGAPLQVYVLGSATSWIPGKNCMAPDALTMGVQIPFKLW